MRALVVVLLSALLSGCGATNQPSQPEPAASQPQPAPSPKAPDEQAAAAALKNVNEAQAGYFKRYRRYALSYDELMESLFLLRRYEPTVLDTGYEIRMHPTATAGSYTISATPATAPETSRHFFTDQSGTIRVEQGKAATAKSPKISR